MTTPLTDAEVLALLTRRIEDGDAVALVWELNELVATERSARKEAEAKAEADLKTYAAGLHDLRGQPPVVTVSQETTRRVADLYRTERDAAVRTAAEERVFHDETRARAEKSEAEVARLQGVVAEMRAALVRIASTSGEASYNTAMSALAADTSPRGVSHATAMKALELLREFAVNGAVPASRFAEVAAALEAEVGG